MGTLAWCPRGVGSGILTSGSKDRHIVHMDPRSPTPVAKSVSHKQEVCGLQWSLDGQQLCSGGNDNKLVLWGVQSLEHETAVLRGHTAAVKAIAWSPYQHGLLVSGGGTADRTIRMWNTHTLENTGVIETGSQVCNLLFSSSTQDLVSSHGYSLNEIAIWKWPQMQKYASLLGHSSRVLYLALSPDGQTVVSGAGDETLRFWKAFPPKKRKITSVSCVLPSGKDLR